MLPTPVTPAASVTLQPTCAVPTGTITVSGVNAGSTYSVVGPISLTNSTGIFTGLVSGSYDVTETNSNGCTSAASSLTVDPVPGAPAVPVASATLQPTCAVPTGTIVVTAPLGGTLEYSIDGTTYQSGLTFAGLTPADYTVSVRDTNDTTCVSTGGSITIDAVPTPPTVPTVASTVQPTCAVPSGAITFDTQAGVEYSVDGTTFQVSEIFTGLAPNTYTLTVRSTTDNTCTTDAASTVTIDAIPTPPTAPVASVTAQPTCAVTSGTIVFTAQTDVEYSIDGGTTYQSGLTFAGLAPGSYDLAVISTVDGTCETVSGSLTIDAVPTAPTAPVASVTAQPTCAVTSGTIVFTAQTDVEYSIDGGTTYQAGLTFAGLTPGSYDLAVISTVDGTCETISGSLTIDAVPTPPAAPVASVTAQPTCAVPTGTIVFTAQTDVEYSIDGGTTYQSGLTFAGLTPGSYDLAVISTVDGTCETVSGSLTIDAIPTAPAAPVASVTVQPTCAVPTGTLVFTTQTDVAYSVDGINFQASEIFAGLAPNDYTLTVRSTVDGTCETIGATLTVDPVPGAPAVPVASATVQPTCAAPTGTIVVTAPTGGTLEYSIDGVNFFATTTFTGLAPADYTVSVRDTNDTTCVSTGGSITIDAVPTPPATPTVASTVQPTCAVTSGTIEFTAQAGVEYSVDGTNFQVSEIFASLAPNTYTLTVRSTTDNTCTTDAASTVTIDAVPLAPATPTVASTVQPTCAVPSGAITFDTQAGVEYSVDGINFQVSEIFTGLAPNTYTLTVRSTTDNTCTTDAASTVTIDAVPLAPSVPVASVTVQPTCAVPTGTLVFTAQTDVAYSVDGINFQASEIFAGLAPNDYTLVVRSTVDGTCETSGATLTVNPVPSAPIIDTVTSSDPTIIACPILDNGSIVITATGSNLEYSIDNGTTFQISDTFSGLVDGTYTIVVRDNATSCSSTYGTPVQLY